MGKLKGVFKFGGSALLSAAMLTAACGSSFLPSAAANSLCAYVSSESDLRDAVDGDAYYITFLNDITLKSELKIKRSLTLDMGDHNLFADVDMKKKFGATVVIYNDETREDEVGVYVKNGYIHGANGFKAKDGKDVLFKRDGKSGNYGGRAVDVYRGRVSMDRVTLFGGCGGDGGDGCEAMKYFPLVSAIKGGHGGNGGKGGDGLKISGGGMVGLSNCYIVGGKGGDGGKGGANSFSSSSAGAGGAGGNGGSSIRVKKGTLNVGCGVNLQGGAGGAGGKRGKGICRVDEWKHGGRGGNGGDGIVYGKKGYLNDVRLANVEVGREGGAVKYRGRAGEKFRLLKG